MNGIAEYNYFDMRDRWRISVQVQALLPLVNNLRYGGIGRHAGYFEVYSILSVFIMVINSSAENSYFAG